MDYVSEQDVMWAFGVLQTNSIGLPTGRALYPIVSVMNHSCAPNMTALTIPGEAIAFKANQDMQTDDEFTIRHQHQSISWKNSFRVCLFVCFNGRLPLRKEEESIPWDLAHILRPNRPYYHP